MRDKELVEAIYDSLLSTIATPLEYATNGHSPLNDTHLMDAAREALAALRFAGWVKCGTCGGTDEVTADGQRPNRLNPTEGPCPDCVEGLVPPEGMVEFVRQETMRGDRLTFSQTTIRTHLIAAARWERESA